MKITSMIAIYFITWWLCLFMVLPWGIRNASEAGEQVVPGNEPGAPVSANFKRKLLYTTILAGAIFSVVYGVYVMGWVGIDDIPMFGPRSLSQAGV